MKVRKEVNPHFKEFVLDWQSKYYFLVGGYGSSKSYHAALKAVLKLLQEKRTCLVVREVYATIRDSCYSLLNEVAESLSLTDRLQFTKSPLQVVFDNGSRILFRGMDKAEKLKSINDISLIWLEEAAEVSYAGFKELTGRLRHPSLKLHMILTTNPVSRSNWTYEHFFTKRGLDDFRLYGEKVLREHDTYYHHSTCEDNKFLPAAYLEQLEEMATYDSDLYRVARLGQFGTNGVKVLPTFEVMSRDKVRAAVEEIPRRYKFAGLDFGFVTSYNCLVRCAVDNEKKWLYIYREWYEKGLTDDEIVSRLAEFAETRELIHCDSAEPKTIRYLQKNGLNATGCKKYAGSRLYNIRKMRRFRRIICSDECANVIRELQDLTYSADRDGNVIEDEFSIDAHSFDALAYALDYYDVADLKYSISREELGV